MPEEVLITKYHSCGDPWCVLPASAVCTRRLDREQAMRTLAADLTSPLKSYGLDQVVFYEVADSEPVSIYAYDRGGEPMLATLTSLACVGRHLRDLKRGCASVSINLNGLIAQVSPSNRSPLGSAIYSDVELPSTAVTHVATTDDKELQLSVHQYLVHARHVETVSPRHLLAAISDWPAAQSGRHVVGHWENSGDLLRAIAGNGTYGGLMSSGEVAVAAAVHAERLHLSGAERDVLFEGGPVRIKCTDAGDAPWLLSLNATKIYEAEVEVRGNVTHGESFTGNLFQDEMLGYTDDLGDYVKRHSP